MDDLCSTCNEKMKDVTTDDLVAMYRDFYGMRDAKVYWCDCCMHRVTRGTGTMSCKSPGHNCVVRLV